MVRISRDGLKNGIVSGVDYVMKIERLPFALRQLLYLILRCFEVFGLQDCDQFRARILLAVPGGAKSADGLRQIGPVIEFGKPALEIAVCEVALDVGGLQMAQMVSECARVVCAQCKPTDRTAIRRAVPAGMKHPILHV
jgi:hypothetical protein